MTDGISFFCQAAIDRTRGSVLKLCQWISGWILEKKIITERVVKQWNRLPREVKDFLSLEMLEKLLEVTFFDMA